MGTALCESVDHESLSNKTATHAAHVPCREVTLQELQTSRAQIATTLSSNNVVGGPKRGYERNTQNIDEVPIA